MLAHVVLVAPEIPWNTGNIGRTCLALGAQLHLVGPLGFETDDKAVRRAGLDYWSRVRPAVCPNWAAFEKETLRHLGRLPWLVTPDGVGELWDAPFGPTPILVFGGESQGLPPELRRAHRARTVRIPMENDTVRALNVSTAVGVALYEVLRQRESLTKRTQAQNAR